MTSTFTHRSFRITSFCIVSTIKKALEILGFVKRHSFEFKNPKQFLLLYNALIWSVSEYGSIIWGPYTKLHIDSNERVQNRFLKLLAFEFNIPIENHDYNPIRTILHIQTLLWRRELLDITFIMYKLINGDINQFSFSSKLHPL